MDQVRGLGRALFAAVLLMVGGVLNIIYGIAARSLSSSVRRFAFEFSERRQPPSAC